MAGRADFGQISEAEFSRLLQVLSSTTKGRAFLARYRASGQPDETRGLLDALQHIEASIGSVRDQLQPERIALELQRIGMTMQIATDGVPTDTDGDETARRFALIDRARRELSALAESLSGEIASAPLQR